MIRGTTAQFRFNIPYTFDELGWVNITFWQPGNNGTIEHPLPIIKTQDQCNAPNSPNEVCVTLNSEETARFSDKQKAYVQLRAQADGNIFASKQEQITVYPINDELLEGDLDLPAPSEDGWIILDGSTIT